MNSFSVFILKMQSFFFNFFISPSKISQQILPLVVSVVIFSTYFFCTSVEIPLSAYRQASFFENLTNKLELILFFVLVVCLSLYIVVKNLKKINYNLNIVNNSTIHLSILVCLSSVFFMSVTNFISLALVFVALNVTLYGLMLRDSVRSAEITIKYFMLGVAATGVLFFGIFLQFLAYATLDYSFTTPLLTFKDAPVLADYRLVEYFASTCFILVFLFKLGIFPFHFYLEELYEGTRLDTLVVITIPVKFAVYFAMLNFLETITLSAVLVNAIFPIFIILGLISVVTGSFGAFRQQSLRAFWSYSYISSMGFVFLGFQVSSNSLCTFVGTYYFLIYLLSWFSILVFFSIFFIRSVSTSSLVISMFEFRYLSQLSLLSFGGVKLQALFQLLLLSLAGIPPSLGFFVKFFVLANTLNSVYTYLALLPILFILPLNAYNYLRLNQAMAFQLKPIRLIGETVITYPKSKSTIVFLLVACILFLVFFPVISVFLFFIDLTCSNVYTDVMFNVKELF